MNDLTKTIHQIFIENKCKKMSFSDVMLYYDEHKKLPFGNSDISMFDIKDAIVVLHDNGIINRCSYVAGSGVTYCLE